MSWILKHITAGTCRIHRISCYYGLANLNQSKQLFNATKNNGLYPHSTFATKLKSSDARSQYLSEELSSRGVVRVCGKDSSEFLQGLITNDMRCLQKSCRTLFSMILNIKGRVLYDMIIHNVSDPGKDECYLLDVDRAVVPELITTIKKYKIRKKVDITDVSQDLKVWTVLPPKTPCEDTEFELNVGNIAGVVSCTRDPRLKALGCRAILHSGIKASSVLPNVTDSTIADLHRQYRYKLGIGEGITDHQPGNCLPLECNLVFLNGVSFDKGCYIGQELTARSHHTGVIRKRLMPFKCSSEESLLFDENMELSNKDGKKVGKLRGMHGTYGLGLLRLSDVKGYLKLTDSSGRSVEAKASHPFWWPEDTK